jgi:large subunit ribosomal protein L9
MTTIANAGFATFTGLKAAPTVRLLGPRRPPPAAAIVAPRASLFFRDVGFVGCDVEMRRGRRGARLPRRLQRRRARRVASRFLPRRLGRALARSRDLSSSTARPSDVVVADPPSPLLLSQRTAAKAAAAAVPRAGGRVSLVVQANKKVAKKANVVLVKDEPNLGKAGDLVEVSLGFFRNHLEPMGKAKQATAEILAEVEANAAAEVAAKTAEQAGAKAIATALSTIGTFKVKKTVGEDGKIFGSVTAADVVEAVELQTSKTLDKKAVNVPDISEVGTYEVTVKLHPEVTGTFKLAVEKA